MYKVSDTCFYVITGTQHIFGRSAADADGGRGFKYWTCRYRMDTDGPPPPLPPSPTYLF